MMDDRPDSRRRLGALLIGYGVGLLAVPVSILTAALALQTIGVTALWPSIPFGLAVSFLIIGRSVSGTGARRCLLTSALLMAPILFGVGWSLYYFDLSTDGQWYQQEGIARIAAGWNPLYRHANGSCYLTPRQLIETKARTSQIDHFPTGNWTIAASWYQATGRIETGKVTNWLLLLSAASLAAAALLELGLSPAWAFGGAAVAALNPVAVCEISTYLCDGEVASLLLALASLYLFLSRRGSLHAAISAAMTIILLVNLKFTAIVLVGMLSGAAMIVAATRVGLRAGARIGATAGAGVILGIAVFGFHPYVQNLTIHRDPFFPVYTHRDVFRELSTAPKVFAGMNQLERLYYSTFGVAEIGTRHDGPIETKAPFVLTAAELRQYKFSNLRIGELGPLFSAALLASLAAGIAAAVSRAPGRGASWALAVLLFLSLLPVELFWWPRYAPQSWYIPMALWAPAVLARGPRAVRYIGGFAAVLFVANLILVVTCSVYFYADDNEWLKGQLRELAREQRPAVDFGEMRSNIIRLREWGVDYVERPGCQPDWDLTNSQTVRCK